MTRPEAIEAAARAQFEQGGVDWDVANGRAKNAARRGAEKALTAAAPHIESALLDRIEEAVKGLRFDARKLRDRSAFDSTDDWVGTLREAWSDEVLGLLSQIREEGGR